jgi:hypothetical protein
VPIGDPVPPRVSLPETATAFPQKQAVYDGPSERELEAWYNVLNDIVQSPPFEHRSSLWDELSDLRDSIYRYLRG